MHVREKKDENVKLRTILKLFLCCRTRTFNTIYGIFFLTIVFTRLSFYVTGMRKNYILEFYHELFS